VTGPHLFASGLCRVEVTNLGQCSCQVVAVGRVGGITLDCLWCTWGCSTRYVKRFAREAFQLSRVSREGVQYLYQIGPDLKQYAYYPGNNPSRLHFSQWRASLNGYCSPWHNKMFPFLRNFRTRACSSSAANILNWPPRTRWWLGPIGPPWTARCRAPWPPMPSQDQRTWPAIEGSTESTGVNAATLHNILHRPTRYVIPISYGHKTYRAHLNGLMFC